MHLNTLFSRKNALNTFVWEYAVTNKVLYSVNKPLVQHLLKSFKETIHSYLLLFVLIVEISTLQLLHFVINKKSGVKYKAFI